jgi:aminobenzoyl-glutamate utilization protein B
MSSDEVALAYLNVHEARLVEIAKAIWDHPEVALQEIYASQLLVDELRQAGFTVDVGAGQMPTAFVASWGTGRPVIGILGEYDALPGLSQAASAVREPAKEGAPGHGCGHNLLGAGSLGAALATREAMERESIPGTIRFYGCPAEETLIGKVFMARDGVFDELDAALAWHPGYANSAGGASSTLAMNSFKVSFHGIAAHAAAAPHMGKSALDGVMLMDIGVNYLREHVEQDVRMHCVITDGGRAPNIVPSEAQAWYYVRAPRREQVDRVYERMLDIAKGAALMSGTTYDIDFLSGCYEVLPNSVIGRVMQARMDALGAPAFAGEDMAFAAQLQGTVSRELLESSVAQELRMVDRGVRRADLGETLCEKIIPPLETPFVSPGSTEVGDVSQITPTSSLTTCCQPLGVPPHGWQVVAASGSGIGFRGMTLAARALALTALDLLTKPATLQAAREEFAESTGGRRYVSPLPAGARPAA